jgi:hypothetical protein
MDCPPSYGRSMLASLLQHLNIAHPTASETWRGWRFNQIFPLARTPPCPGQQR